MASRTLIVLLMATGLITAQPAADPALPRELRAIRAIDNHPHVVRPVPGDHDYDALPFELPDPPPAGSIPAPVFLRPDNPAFVRAWKALFLHPHADASTAHARDAAR
jgi:hypothetical protein